MSAAYKRDFLATASKDLTVRVWQFSPGLRLVLTHLCHHSPLAVAIDPYGRELVVCYVDGTRWAPRGVECCTLAGAQGGRGR